MVAPRERRNWRTAWFQRVMERLSTCDLVFADPDNGIIDDANWRRGRAKFGKQMQAQGTGAPQGVNQAEQIAKVDDMRRKFEEGMSQFKSAGKDIYSLPW